MLFRNRYINFKKYSDKGFKQYHIPPVPPQLKRSYHARNEYIYIINVNNDMLHKTNEIINNVDLPYGWIPIRNNNNTQWYRRSPEQTLTNEHLFTSWILVPNGFWE